MGFGKSLDNRVNVGLRAAPSRDGRARRANASGSDHQKNQADCFLPLPLRAKRRSRRECASEVVPAWAFGCLPGCQAQLPLPLSANSWNAEDGKLYRYKVRRLPGAPIRALHSKSPSVGLPFELTPSAAPRHRARPQDDFKTSMRVRPASPVIGAARSRKCARGTASFRLRPQLPHTAQRAAHRPRP